MHSPVEDGAVQAATELSALESRVITCYHDLIASKDEQIEFLRAKVAAQRQANEDRDQASRERTVHALARLQCRFRHRLARARRSLRRVQTVMNACDRYMTPEERVAASESLAACGLHAYATASSLPAEDRCVISERPPYVAIGRAQD